MSCISLDCWGTLIIGNPKFKKAKNDLIREFSNFPNKEMFNDYFIEDQIKVIKKKHDDILETYGTQPDVKHLFAELCYIFAIPSSKFEMFYIEYQSLFIQNQPLIYSEDTVKVLNLLRKEGHSILISSNTLFTDPESMALILYRLGIRSLNAKYSAIEGVSKPNHNMFFHGTDIHVGDNPKTDGSCTKYGIEFFQINSNNKTINDLYNHVSLFNQDRKLQSAG